MKKMKNSNVFTFVIATTFAALASIVVSSGSFLLFGEPKCPKSLLK